MSDDQTPRERILLEATKLFGQHGYNATSVREVVEAAGVTKPTLYYYFASKEALFREAVQAQFAGLELLVDAVLAHPGSARERCQMFLEMFVSGGLLNRDNVLLMVMANNGMERGQPRIPLITIFSEQILRLEQLFDRDPTVATAMLVGSANELLFRGLDGMDPPENYAERVVSLLFDGTKGGEE